MKIRRGISLWVALLMSAGIALAQDKKPLSPSGSAATQVGGKWTPDSGGASRYGEGKWIEVTYSRPILRGRADIFGSGADYGKKVNAGAPVWRLGANQTTKLTTEVPLTINGKTLAAGSYDLFVELKESGWTLIVSTQPTQAKYDPKFDVVRAPMTMSKTPHSVDQLTIAFLDMTDAGGKLAVAWDGQAGMVDFTVGH